MAGDGDIDIPPVTPGHGLRKKISWNKPNQEKYVGSMCSLCVKTVVDLCSCWVMYGDVMFVTAFWFSRSFKMVSTQSGVKQQ